MNQSDIFLSGEGDAWYERNKDKLGQRDPVCSLLDLKPLIRPKRVLEVGCANGWRLHKLEAKYGCRVSGIDTSSIAVNDAVASGLDDVCFGKFGEPLWLGGTFDMIIFAFCLYVMPPQDWFKVVTEADRLLSDGGWLVIHDFEFPPVLSPYSVGYEHNPEARSYHMDFSKLWLVHPWYTTRDGIVTNDEIVEILKKDTSLIERRA